MAKIVQLNNHLLSLSNLQHNLETTKLLSSQQVAHLRAKNDRNCKSGIEIAINLFDDGHINARQLNALKKRIMTFHNKNRGLLHDIRK